MSPYYHHGPPQNISLFHLRVFDVAFVSIFSICIVDFKSQSKKADLEEIEKSAISSLHDQIFKAGCFGTIFLSKCIIHASECVFQIELVLLSCLSPLPLKMRERKCDLIIQEQEKVIWILGIYC